MKLTKRKCDKFIRILFKIKNVITIMTFFCKNTLLTYREFVMNLHIYFYIFLGYNSPHQDEEQNQMNMVSGLF